MNPQSIYHAYAMSYVELDNARTDAQPVPPSVLARLAGSDPGVVRAVMRALKDVERGLPLRSKQQIVAMFPERATASAA
jgi:hypothetical protein